MSLAARTLGSKATNDEAYAERRKGGRRREDLDSAYNDGATPTSLGSLRGWLFYGGASLLVLTSLLGTFDILKALWSVVAVHVLKH